MSVWVNGGERESSKTDVCIGTIELQIGHEKVIEREADKQTDR